MNWLNGWLIPNLRVCAMQTEGSLHGELMGLCILWLATFRQLYKPLSLLDGYASSFDKSGYRRFGVLLCLNIQG